MIVIILIHKSLRGLQGRWLMEWSLESDRPESICRCAAYWPSVGGLARSLNSESPFKRETRLVMRAGCEDGICSVPGTQQSLATVTVLFPLISGQGN